jgi:hypothetical protein
MPSRRQFSLMLAGAILCGGLVISPLRLSMENGTASLTSGGAAAKEGKGNGNSRGKGDTGSKGNGGGKGDGKGGKGGAAGKSTKAGSTMEGIQQVNPKTGDRVRFDGAGIEVVHRNGMRERISRGSYKMTDNRGRTIIERRATGADLARLRRMAG